jgi:hypothetical protein
MEQLLDELGAASYRSMSLLRHPLDSRIYVSDIVAYYIGICVGAEFIVDWICGK